MSIDSTEVNTQKQQILVSADNRSDGHRICHCRGFGFRISAIDAHAPKGRFYFSVKPNQAVNFWRLLGQLKQTL